MSASKSCHGLGAQRSSTSRRSGKREDTEIKSPSTYSDSSIFQCELCHLDAQYAACQTPPAIDAWKAELNELPTLYEQIIYGRTCEIGGKYHIADTRPAEPAIQFISKQKIDNKAIKEDDMDLSFVGAFEWIWFEKANWKL